MTRVIDGWRAQALLATTGTRFGAILHAVWQQPVPQDSPEFLGLATVTSDGFILCDFRDAKGRNHRGAFVGSYNELFLNVRKLARHLDMTPDQRDEFENDVDGWIDTDFRSNKERA